MGRISNERANRIYYEAKQLKASMTEEDKAKRKEAQRYAPSEPSNKSTKTTSSASTSSPKANAKYVPMDTADNQYAQALAAFNPGGTFVPRAAQEEIAARKAANHSRYMDALDTSTRAGVAAAASGTVRPVMNTDETVAVRNEWAKKAAQYEADRQSAGREFRSARGSDEYRDRVGSFDSSAIPYGANNTGRIRYALDDDFRARLDTTNQGLGLLDPTYENLKYLNDFEKNDLANLVAQGDYERANKYLDHLQPELNARLQRERTNQTVAMTQRDPAAGVIANVTAAKEAWLGVLPVIQGAWHQEMGEYKPVDTNGVAFRAAHMVNDTTKGVGDAAERAARRSAREKALRELPPDATEAEKMAALARAGATRGKIARVLAEAGLSAAQNATLLPMGGTAPLVFMGSMAAGQSALDTLESGGTAQDALKVAAATGIIEAATEKIGIDNFFRISRLGSKSIKDFLKGAKQYKLLANDIGTFSKALGSQMAAEGVEEMIAEVAGNLADTAIRGDNGQYAQLVQNYMANGMSEEQAKARAFTDMYIGNVAKAGITGALAGGMLGAGGATIGTYQTSARNRELVRSFESVGNELQNLNITPEQLISAVQQSGSRDAQEYARELSQKLALGEEVTTAEMGRLHLLSNNYITSKDYEAVQKAAIAEEESRNAGGNVRESERNLRGSEAAAGVQQNAGNAAGAQQGEPLQRSQNQPAGTQNVTNAQPGAIDVASKATNNTERIESTAGQAQRSRVEVNPSAVRAKLTDAERAEIERTGATPAIVEEDGKRVRVAWRGENGTIAQHWFTRAEAFYKMANRITQGERSFYLSIGDILTRISQKEKKALEQTETTPVIAELRGEPGRGHATVEWRDKNGNVVAQASFTQFELSIRPEWAKENFDWSGKDGSVGLPKEKPSSQAQPSAAQTATGNAVANAEGRSETAAQTKTVAETSWENIQKIVRTKAKGGLSQKDEYTMNSAGRRAFDRIGRALGVEIHFVDRIVNEEGEANGLYQNGHIFIARNAENPYHVVLAHEITHHFEKTAPDVYEKFKSAALKMNPGLVERYMAMWGYDEATAEFEVAADFAGELLEKEGTVKRVIKEDISAARGFHRAMNAVFDKVRGDDTKGLTEEERKLDAQLDAARDMWRRCLRETRDEKTGDGNTRAEAIEFSDSKTQFSLRKTAPPKKTGKAYKVFVAKNGQLYPPKVANPGGEGTPVGVWLDADVGESAPPSKTGRAQVKSGGKGTDGGSGSLAFRPGWHMGDIPYAKQFARTNPETGKKELFPANFVWAECEYAADVDYQDEAMSYGYTENGKFRHSYAGLPKVPTDGYYRYRTNPDPDTVPWIISGAMKVTRILTDEETDAICRENGVEPMKRQGGALTAAAMEEKFGIKAGEAEGGESKGQFSRKLPTAQEIEDELNASDIHRTSSKNEKNRARIDKYLSEHYPNLYVDYINYRSTGEVKVKEVMTKAEFRARQEERDRKDAERRKRREAVGRFQKRIRTPSGRKNLIQSIENHLKRDNFDDATVRSSRSMVRTMSFYVEGYGITIKVSDHFTGFQQTQYPGEFFVNTDSMANIAEVYKPIKRFMTAAKELYAEDEDIDTDAVARRAREMREEEVKQTAPQMSRKEADKALASAGVAVDEKSESGYALQPQAQMLMQFSRKTFKASDYSPDSPNFKAAVKALAKQLGVTQKQAKQFITDVNSVASAIAHDPARLDYVSAEGEGRSAFVSNAEYGGSIDFSTICPKRRMYMGTVEAIQKAMPDKVLSADDILKIRNMMKDKGYQVACGFCYVEGSRAKLGYYTNQFRKELRGAGEEYVPTQAELMNIESLDRIRREHHDVYEKYLKFMNSLAQRKPKLFQPATEYNGEIIDKFGKDRDKAKVADKNWFGGLRIFSFSDFEAIHMIDMMQVVLDMARVGLAGQAYTKQPDFARVFGGTGIKINLSLVANGVDENGRLTFDGVEGMKIEDAMEIRDTYPDNVGTIVVTFTEAQLKAAMADDRIDFFIPFHRSQWTKKQYGRLGLPADTKDMTYWQNERYFKGKAPTRVNKNGKTVREKAKNFMPNTYWDFKKDGKKNAEAYLKMCAEANKKPKFWNLLVDNKDGSYSLQPDGSTDGYWKLLGDWKMYNHKTGKGVPQKPVKPDFNMTEANRVLSEYKGGHESFPVAQDVVNEFVRENGGKTNPQLSRKLTPEQRKLDEDYMAAVERGDMEAAQRMVDEAAKRAFANSKITDEDGNLLRVYHGTSADFTVFDKTKGRANMDIQGMFFSPWEIDAEGYGDKVGAYYLNITKPANESAGYRALNKFKGRNGAGVKAREHLESLGFDGVNNGDEEFIAFNPNQIKSADPATYDDKGKLIPLSERFNEKKDDIRFSRKLTPEGQTQSQQFKRWFGDWQNDPENASKVVNKDGTPKVVYHQTARAFWTFDNSNPVEGKNDSETPSGFFFKENDHDIGIAGDRQVAVYLDMKKPLHFANREEALAWYKKNVKGYAKLHDEMEDAIRPIEQQLDDINSRMFEDISDEEYERLSAQEDALIGQLRSVEDDYRGKLHGMLNDHFLTGGSGYDGIMLDDDGHRWVNRKREDVKTYIVFDRRQIKSATNNVGTFDRSNPDIRYSRKGQDAAMRRANRLARENARLKGQFKLTKGVKLRESDIRKVTRELLKDYEIIDYDKEQFERYIKMMAEAAAQADESNADATWDSIRNVAHGLSREVGRAAFARYADVDEEHDADLVRETYEDIRQRLGRQRVLSPWFKDPRVENESPQRKEMRDYYRRKLFGVLTLTSDRSVDKGSLSDIGKLYEELTEAFGEAYFPSDVTNDEDQIIRIADVLDDLKDTLTQIGERTPVTVAEDVEQSSRDETRRAAYEEEVYGELYARLEEDILNRIAEVRREKPTFADKKKAEQYDAVERAIEQTQSKAEAAEIANRIEDAKKYRERIAKLEARLNKLKEENKGLKGEARQTQKDIREADTYYRQAAQEALREAKAQKREALQELKDKYKAKTAEARERQNARELRKKIEKYTKDLYKTLAKPTNEKHINEDVRPAAALLISLINQESLYTTDYQTGKPVRPGAPPRLTDNGLPAVRIANKRTEAARKMRKAAEQIFAGEDNYLLIYDPELMEDLAIMEDWADKPLATMSSAELQVVWDAVRGVEHMITQSRKVFNEGRQWEIGTLASGLVRDVDLNNPRRTIKYGAAASVDKLLNIDQLTPQAFFHRFGEGGDRLFRMLRRSQDKYVRIIADIQARTAEVIKDIDIDKLNKDIATYKVKGGDVTLSRAQVLLLYASIKREQAAGHILGGGIKAKPLKGKGLFETKQLLPVEVTQEDLDNMFKEAKLTEAEKKAADGLVNIMSTVLAEYGNEASLRTYGYAKFREGWYVPIETDPTSNKTDNNDPLFKQFTAAASIAGRGFAKQTKEGAKNAIMVGSLFDVYAKHVNDMAMYAAYVETLENMRRIRNFKFEDGTKTQNYIEALLTQSGVAYWDKLINDINGGERLKNDDFSFDRFVGAYKAAAVSANIRVILQQPTAIIRAAAEINPAYLIAAMRKIPKRHEWDRVKKNSAIAQWKDWGYFDINTGRQMRDVVLGTDSLFEKFKQAGLRPMSGADSFAWTLLYHACEDEAKAKGLRPGDAAFDSFVASRFSDIIDKTQVVDGVLQRSQIMRSTNAVTKMATSFMAEPTKTYNMFLSAVWDFRHARSKTEKQAAKKKLGFTVAALVVSFLVNAAAQSLIDALRDDDRDKEFLDKFWDAYLGRPEEDDKNKAVTVMGGNLWTAFNPITYIPFFKDIVSLVQGYSTKRMDMESIGRVIDAAEQALAASKGEGKQTAFARAMTLASEVSRVFGLPLANIKRDAVAVLNTIAQEKKDYGMMYNVDRAFYKLDKNVPRYVDIMLKAHDSGDAETEKRITDDLHAAGVDDKKIKDAADKIRQKQQNVDSVTEIKDRYRTYGEAASYNKLESYAKGTSTYRQANATERSKYEKMLEDALANNDTAQERHEKAQELGVSDNQYMEFLVAQDVANRQRNDGTGDNEGKPGGVSKNDYIAALDMTSMTQSQKSAAFAKKYPNSKTGNPYN